MIARIGLAIISLLVLFSMLVTSCRGSIRVEKEIVYVDRPVEIVKEVVKEVEVAKPVYHTVQVEKEVLVELEDWESVDELIAFLEEDDTDKGVILVANSDGKVAFNGQCEDRAIQLMDRAQEKGKRLSFVPLHPMEYLKWYGESIPSTSYHAICGALVGDNEFYYIEPDTDKCWVAQYLD